jgi:hypothetical protein
LVRSAPVTVQVPQKNGEDSGAGEASQKTYDSYQIVYYEGSERKILRRSTPEKAKERAGEIAKRLSRLGPQAEIFKGEII